MKYIDEVDLKNKKVLLRCDFNVPLKDGNILDDSRILKSLTTINYLLEQNCGIILMSHLGRIKVREDRFNNSLKPVSEKLSKLLNKEIKFLASPVGMEVLTECKNLQNGEIILLENTRFCDFPEKLESNNDDNLSKDWSTLADIFVVDAFASLHRSHASVAGISKYLPTYFGLLVKEEITNLKPVIDVQNRPFGVFMGGAKVDDKLKYIKNILTKCDYLLIGGGIANSFLKALGYDIKDSLSTSDEITLEDIRRLLNEYKSKIILPVDFAFENNSIVDLNVKSINKYLNVLSECKTIFVNGSCGIFEQDSSSKGTYSLFKGLENIDAIKIAGGGDTLNAINKFSLEKSFSFLSSGGGASLEYISNNHLDAIDFIENNNKFDNI